MVLLKAYLTQNPCYVNNVNKADSRYTTFQQRGPLGGMLHSVGCAQPSALVFVNLWNKASYTAACVHSFIDANTGDVYQTLPWYFRGWHGAGSCNNTHIGVEMCESKYIRYLEPGESGYAPGKFVVLDQAKARADCTRAYNAAVELFAMLAKLYKWDVDTAILSHYEGGQKGIASAHGDPEHYWKGLGMSYTMDGFRAAVKATMEPAPVNPFVDVKEGKSYYEAVLWAVANGITKGTDATHFSPDKPCTRGQMVTFLHRMDQYLKGKG